MGAFKVGIWGNWRVIVHYRRRNDPCKVSGVDYCRGASLRRFTYGMSHRNSALKSPDGENAYMKKNRPPPATMGIASAFAAQIARRTYAWVFRIYRMLYCLRKRKYNSDAGGLGDYKYPM